MRSSDRPFGVLFRGTRRGADDVRAMADAHRDEQHLIRIEADVAGIEQRQRSQGEAGAGQQDDRERELQHDERVRQPRPATRRRSARRS